MMPKVVCLCGSTRFHATFEEANLSETLEGHIVLSIGCNLKSDDEVFKGMAPAALRLIKAKLDVLHLHKIEMSDEILVINEDGYIGESTEREIEYARSIGVGIRYWRETE